MSVKLDDLSPHMGAFENNNPSRSIFARHLIDEDHRNDEENILSIEKNYKLRLALEMH